MEQKDFMLSFFAQMHGAETVVSGLKNIEQATTSVAKTTTQTTFAFKDLNQVNASVGSGFGQVGKQISAQVGFMRSGDDLVRNSTITWMNLQGQLVKTSFSEKQISGQFQVMGNTVSVASAKAGAGVQSFADILGKSAIRALIVAPVWLALRSAMMLVLSTIGAMMKANFDLEEGMARIQTVMQGTGSEISAQMAGIKRVILDTSLTTKVSIKDLAEAFYFLKTSALTAEEALAGFPALVNIITGTNIKAQEASRGLAGMYNTAGKTLGENLTVTEKMNKIADTLTYTYARQDVEMGELIAGYAKLAPYLVGLDDSFVDIVTTLGFLNTHLLRGARTGTMTAQSILNLSKASKELSSAFGITFDPTKAVSFIDVIEKMKIKMGDTTVLTKAQQDAMFEVFNVRGGTSPRLLLAFFDEWKTALKDAGTNAEGFAKKIADIRMNTITAQMAEMSNIFAVLTNDFISGVYGVGDYAQALKALNETMIAIRPNIRGLGLGIGYISEQFGVFMATLSAMGDKQMLNELGKQVRGFGAYIDEQLRLEADSRKRQKEAEALTKIPAVSQEFKINAQKEYEEELKKTYDIMKANGASELDIQKAKVAEYERTQIVVNKIKDLEYEININKESAKKLSGNELLLVKAKVGFLEEDLMIQQSIKTLRESSGSEADYELKKTQEINALLVKQVEYRNQITSTLQNVGLDLLKAMGTSEAQIISLKMRELALNRQAGDDASYLAQLEALRLSRIQAIVSEKLKERDIQGNLILAYQKADDLERGRIRRLIELRKLDKADLEKQYEKSPYDAQIIIDNINKFSEEVQDMIIDKLAEKFELTPPEKKQDIVRNAEIEANTTQVTANTKALMDNTAIMQILSKGSMLSATNTGIPLALDTTRGAYKTPKEPEPYVPWSPLPSGSVFKGIPAPKRDPMELLIDLNVKGLDEEMRSRISERVKKLISEDEGLQAIIANRIRDII